MLSRIACIAAILCVTTTVGYASAERLDALPSIREDTIRVFIVRHGHSGNNLPNSDQLSDDERDQLTGLGETQSRAIAEALKEQPIVGLYASPTRRTRNTLRPLAEALGLRIHTDPAFAAMKLGLADEGEPATFSWRAQQWEAGADPRPQDGESMSDITQRAFDRIRAFRTAYGSAIIICTHGDVVAAFIGAAKDTHSWDRWPRFESELGSIHVIDVPKHGPAIPRAIQITVR